MQLKDLAQIAKPTYLPWRLFTYTEQTLGEWTIVVPFLFSGDNMTVLNTADWLLSCSTPSSATSMGDPGTVHACAGVPSWLLCNISLGLLCSFVMWFEYFHSVFSPTLFFSPLLRGIYHSQKTGRKLQYMVILPYFESHLVSKKNLSHWKLAWLSTCSERLGEPRVTNIARNCQ